MDTEEKPRTFVTVDLPTELREWLEREAKAEDRSMSAVVRIALAQYRDKVEAA